MARLIKKINFYKHLGITLTFLMTAGLFSSAPFCRAEQNNFPLKDGDTWVMVGDSITAQHLHTNYFEAFCYARFPELTFHFRNSGVGGDTITKVLARFNWDVETWKPTIVSVELGMNDSGAGPNSTPAYISNMEKLVDRIHKAGARPILFTASPVNDGTVSQNLIGRNLTLDRYATALGEFAVKKNILYTNQFHALLDLWGGNKIAENLTRLSESAKTLVSKTNIPGHKFLKQWLDEWERSEMKKRGIDLTGDPVHLGPPGQMTMCTALLKGLNAPGLVSKATLNSSGRLIEEINCQVTNIKQEDGALSFDRFDESLPMPIPDNCHRAVEILPSIEDLSQWILTVKNIKDGDYDVYIDSVKVATVSSSELENGWNMGLLEKGPVAEQCQQILKLVAEKERIVSQWRAKAKYIYAAEKPEQKEILSLEQISKNILDADRKIKDTAQPKMHNFVIKKTNEK